MNDVPRFVRQRMAQQQASGAHPDANLLTALAEDALTARERKQVLAHLGTCAACRETVAFAMPEIPATPTTATSSAWFRWPRLHWASVAAAVVVVAAAVVMQNSRRTIELPKRSAAEVLVKHEEAVAPPSSTSVKEVAPRLDDRLQTEELATRDARAKVERSADEKKKDAFAADVAIAGTVGVQSHALANNAVKQAEPRMDAYGVVQQRVQVQNSNQAQIQNSNNAAGAGGILATEQNRQQTPAAAPPPQIPRATESVEVVQQAEAVETQKAGAYDSMSTQKSSVQDKAQAKSDVSSRQYAGGALHGSAATRPSPLSGGPVVSPGEAGAGTAMRKVAVFVSPQWRLSAEGLLERSVDAGGTWQLVQVAVRPPRLRSLSVVGSEIWAAGSGGALYHSVDNGRTWNRVNVKAADTVLDEDIVRVEFTDPQRGALKTTSGETWTTNDAGASWSVRR